MILLYTPIRTADRYGSPYKWRRFARDLASHSYILYSKFYFGSKKDPQHKHTRCMHACGCMHARMHACMWVLRWPKHRCMHACMWVLRWPEHRWWSEYGILIFDCETVAICPWVYRSVSSRFLPWHRLKDTTRTDSSSFKYRRRYGQSEDQSPNKVSA